MNISSTGPRPIPPSGITRISLWKHGMERPAMVSPAEFRIDVGLMLNNKSALYDHITEPNKLRKTLFNFSFETTTARFGYVPAFKGEHDTIVCPSKEEKPFKGLIFPFGDIPTIMLTHEDRSVFSGSTEEQDLFNGFVTMARFLAENLFPQQSYLDYGTTLDLDMLNQSTNNLLFKGSIKTLADLARQALPQDIPPSGINEFRLWRVGDETSRQVEPEEFRKAIEACCGRDALFNVCLIDDYSVSLGVNMQEGAYLHSHISILGGRSSDRAFSGYIREGLEISYSVLSAHPYMKLGPGYTKHLADDYIRIARCFVENGCPAQNHLSISMAYDVGDILRISARTISDLARQPLTGEPDADR